MTASRLPHGFNDREEIAKGLAALKLSNAFRRAMMGDEPFFLPMTGEEAIAAAKMLGMPPEALDQFFKGGSDD